MNELKLTPIDQIEDMADGVPVLAIEGVVKFAGDVKTGTSPKGHAWSKQFFVLGSETAEIGCSMWDALDNELSKGERVRIENTHNKKGQWNGITKGSYQKDGERKHTLEIRANQVKIVNLDKNNATPEPQTMAGQRDYEPKPDPDWPEAEQRDTNGVGEARRHLMQSANLYNLCVSAVDKAIAPNMPNIAQTSEQFQAAVGTLFIEASRAGFVTKMPEKPL